MNCREAEELFDLHVDGGLDAATSRILENHLQGCSSCRTAHDAVKAESELLRQALQADLSSAAQIARIQARVHEGIRPAALVVSIGEWVMAVLGILLGLLVLVWGSFDSTGVREAVSLSLNPRGGLLVAIPTVLVAALGVLAVIVVQPLLLRINEQE
ncbi:MAG: zf-HC2 domain-containing protein [Acidobacteria bacterium]|nr:MAG: zf-HC2 domain-containing protein [Acidobacteriota bacterium]